MKKIARALLSIGLAVGITAGAASQAEASVGYKIKTCSNYTGNYLQVSSWINDARTQKTYHFLAVARGYNTEASSFSLRDVYWKGSALNVSSTIRAEGYRYSSYLGDTYWEAGWQRYAFGVPVYVTYCGFYV